MGKPSSSSSKRTKSSHSLLLNAAMSSTKMEIKNKKQWSNRNKNIKKLFQGLRSSNSSVSLDSSANTTVINLDSIPDKKTPKKKRKISPSKTPSNESYKIRKTNSEAKVIVINDEDTPSKFPSQVVCSTPNRSLNITNDLNLSNICNEENNNSVQKDIQNLTKHLNMDSYLTIDLTAESSASRSLPQTTVIDLNKSDTQDCILINNSESNASMSGDSDVTVLRVNSRHKQTSEERRIRRFANGIANLDASSKGKLLELITQKIFSGCDIPKSLKNKARESRATETVEDTYIKEVILGQCPSRNSIGSNIYNPERDAKKTGLRMIVIDGSNVAMEHGKGRSFSVKGLKICIDYFLNRSHSVKAFVPRFRCKFGKSTDPRLLDDLERKGLVVYTPSREIQGKTITSYDDRYIIQCAAEFDGVIVSGDNYRDLLLENPRWRRVIEQRLLPFTWVQDMLMFPRDPLGRNGPTLEQFLRHTDS